MTSDTVLLRKDAPAESQWHVDHVFASWNAWETEFNAVKAALPEVQAYVGRLGEGPNVLADWLDFAHQMRRRAAPTALSLHAYRGQQPRHRGQGQPRPGDGAAGASAPPPPLPNRKCWRWIRIPRATGICCSPGQNRTNVWPSTAITSTICYGSNRIGVRLKLRRSWGGWPIRSAPPTRPMAS
ncbi:MAG: hypothetical protein R2873_10885 [Caldilineaceae bacterium]